jgi:hypothetical protein
VLAADRREQGAAGNQDDLRSLAKDINARAAEGKWAITLGAPHAGAIGAIHAHEGQFYKDEKSRLFWLDIDDLPVPAGLGHADRFAEGAVYAISLLPEAFRHAARILIRTTSTGSRPDHFSGRIAFVLGAPLKLDAMRTLAGGIAALSGFAVTAEEREKRLAQGLRAEIIDLGNYAPGRFLFISPPECEDGVVDPGRGANGVRLLNGEPLDPIEAANTLNVDLKVAQSARKTRMPISAALAGSGADPYAGRVLDVPEPRREALLRNLVSTLPNNLDRNAWIGTGHAIKGACAGADYGFEIFDEFSERWEGGKSNYKENQRAWDTLPANGRNGIDYLVGWAVRIGTPEARSAVAAIDKAWREALIAAFPDFTEGEIAEARAKPHKFYSLSEFAAQFKPLSYIIDGLIAAGTLYTLRAPTTHGKTAFLIALSFANAAGRKDIIGIEARTVRVAYLSFENPDGVRMRMMAAAHKLGIDMNALGDKLMICPASVSPEETVEALSGLSNGGGAFGLVIVDTLQAAFDGDDFNNNKQVLDFVRRFRPVTALPGARAVIIAAHLVKNPERKDLVPYGGGAILNEIDGNLTLWNDGNGNVELHWQRKWRGLDFDPKSFTIELHEPPTVRDDKGRSVRLPVLRPLSAADMARRKIEIADTKDAVLVAILRNPAGTMEAWATAVGRNRSNVSRALRDLRDKGSKFVTEVGGKWVLTPKGRKRAEEIDKSDADEIV